MPTTPGNGLVTVAIESPRHGTEAREQLGVAAAHRERTDEPRGAPIGATVARGDGVTDTLAQDGDGAGGPLGRTGVLLRR